MSTPDTPAVPADVTLDQLKKQARRLLRSIRDGDPDALSTLASHPRSIDVDQAKLTDAQLLVARTHGFDSWPRLRLHVAGRDLRQAIWDHDVDAVRAAIDVETDVLTEAGPHPRWGGQPTPLQLAAERGEVDVVRLLVERGADVDGTGSYGWTPIQLAAHWGHDDVVQALRDLDAQYDIYTACLAGDAEAVAPMLAADPSLAVTASLDDGTPLHQARTEPVARALVDAGAPLDRIDSSGRSALSAAIGRGALDVARFLLAQGADASPCELAGLGDIDRLQQRLNSDPAANAFVGAIGLNAVQGTPLLAAVHAGHADVVTLLLQQGADIHARADMGQTALHLVSDADLARTLVERGADPAAVDDEHGTTPLVWARIAIDIHGPSESRQALVEYLQSLEQ